MGKDCPRVGAKCSTATQGWPLICSPSLEKPGLCLQPQEASLSLIPPLLGTSPSKVMLGKAPPVVLKGTFTQLAAAAALDWAGDGAWIPLRPTVAQQGCGEGDCAVGRGPSLHRALCVYVRKTDSVSLPSMRRARTLVTAAPQVHM